MVGSFTEPPLLSRETVLTEIPASFARSFEDSTPDFSMAALNLVLLIRYITIATPFDLWYCVSITSVVDDTLHLCLSQYHICDFYSMHRNEDYILEFYNTFELLCKKKGVTPTRAARESGIAQSVASMWKKRGSTPSGENLQKLANYFGCTVEYLLGDVPEPAIKATTILTDLSKKSIEDNAKVIEGSAGAFRDITNKGLQGLTDFEIQSFAVMLHAVGYSFRYSEEEKQGYILDGKKEVPVSIDEIKALSRTTRASVRGIIQDFIGHTSPK